MLRGVAWTRIQRHKKFQLAVRKFVDDVVFPDAQARELDGKRPSQEVFDKMACMFCSFDS